jgi:hypothetical protein
LRDISKGCSSGFRQNKKVLGDSSGTEPIAILIIVNENNKNKLQ